MLTNGSSRAMVTRVWLSVAAVVAIGVVLGGITMFGWMIGETHFDRPDEGFDRLTAQVENAPGVSVDWTERWVEAPTFANPRSWISLTVDEAHLPGLLSFACSADYPDAVDWSLNVTTASASTVSLYTSAAPRTADEDSHCPDFGFDAVGLVAEVGRSVPDVDLQAAIWEDGRLALVVLGEEPEALSGLLPLVDHAAEVRDAAGLDPTRHVEINAATLTVVIPPGEDDQYLALLSDLAQNHGVTSYWADGGGIPIDGVDKVQIVAPDREHSGIEDAIRASGLHVADLPVRFIPADS